MKGSFERSCFCLLGRSCSSGNSLDENQNIVLKDPSGVIKTPGYPHGYPGDKLIEQCFWKITAPKGTVLRVEFSSFRLPDDECVVVVFVINGRFPMEGYICDLNPPFVLYSVTNELGIYFLGSTAGQGFIANYTTIPAGKSGRLKC